VHVIQGDRADAAAAPDVAHALENFSIRQPEPGLPQLVHAEVRGYLEDAANVEYHRTYHHDGPPERRGYRRVYQKPTPRLR
jgi:hypothetical protein